MLQSTKQEEQITVKWSAIKTGYEVIQPLNVKLSFTSLLDRICSPVITTEILIPFHIYKIITKLNNQAYSNYGNL